MTAAKNEEFMTQQMALRELIESGRRDLELGCGSNKRSMSAVGVDLLPAHGVDIVGDATVLLRALPDNCVSSVSSHHFLEHLDDPVSLIAEIGRILQVGGTMTATVPHFSNPYFYSDPTHRSAFGLYFMSYLAEDRVFKRTVPTYSRIPGLYLTSAELGFRSARPKYVRHAILRIIQTIVNSSRFSKELYEELLSGVVPCYEIRFTVSKSGHR